MESGALQEGASEEGQRVQEGDPGGQAGGVSWDGGDVGSVGRRGGRRRGVGGLSGLVESGEAVGLLPGGGEVGL